MIAIPALNTVWSGYSSCSFRTADHTVVHEEGGISTTNILWVTHPCCQSATRCIRCTPWIAVLYRGARNHAVSPPGTRRADDRWFEGFEAIVIQHEMDHLSGKLFTQRAVEQGHELMKEVGNGEFERYQF
jgi:hypothetical protein